MENRTQYVIQSLELHLFFARIMKEHALFLEAGFTPRDAAFARKAEGFKVQFERLLARTVQLSNHVVGEDVLCSGEVVTEFTALAERQTERFTGIAIDRRITAMQERLQSAKHVEVSDALARQTRQLNENCLRQLDGLIALKESILTGVNSCRMFTMNYPLLIEHILREARLYRTYIRNLEKGCDLDGRNMRETELFWNQIMMEHALFIRGLLDPTENDLIQASNEFAGEYARLLEKSREKNEATCSALTNEALRETVKFRDFKMAGTQGIEECKIRSVILPLLADHVLREANHYIRLLDQK